MLLAVFFCYVIKITCALKNNRRRWFRKESVSLWCAESCVRSYVQVAKTDCKCLFCCINRMILHQKPGWTHRSFWNLTGLSQGGDLRQNAGSVRLHVPAESGLGHTPPDLWPDEEYCRKLSVLSVLGRPCKYNIYKNIEGKADIPPFQCINSDVQKWASIFLP